MQGQLGIISQLLPTMKVFDMLLSVRKLILSNQTLHPSELSGLLPLATAMLYGNGWTATVFTAVFLVLQIGILSPSTE